MNNQDLLSPFIEDCLRRYPTLSLQDNAFVKEAKRADFLQHLQEKTQGMEEEAFLQQLTQLRHSLWAQLAYLEINNLFPLEQSAKQMSYFAEACLLHVADYSFNQLCARFGVPRDETHQTPLLWSILCMGKLGGEELNFSSDIDIILCYDDSGCAIKSHEMGIVGELGCRIPVPQFYQHFAKVLSSTLNQNSPLDMVFRVDMRLRPFGSSGALVCSYSYLQNYLQSHARDWERLAYAKAKVLSPNGALKHHFEQIIEPFVYRQYTDYGVLQSIRDMRDMIADTTQDKRYKDDIKIGFGGIRLLEFTLQSIQLTLYIKHSKLKVRGAFNLLRSLRQCKALDIAEVQGFEQHLFFLRKLEHRLQIWQDKQTHLLPASADKEQWQWLSDSMQCNSVEDLQQQIQVTRQAVHRIFEQVLPDYPIKDYTLFHNDTNYDQESLTYWLDNMLNDDVQHALFGNFIGCLNELLASRIWRQTTPQARDRLSQLLPRLVEMIIKYRHQSNELSNNKEVLFEDDWSNLFRLLSAILQRSAYISLLCEYPMVSRRVLAWCQEQPWLIQQVIDYPVLLESVISPHHWQHEIHRNTLRRQLCDMRLNPQLNYEKKINQLRAIKHSAIFKVAELNQTGSLDTYRVSDCLTNIAREVVIAALHIASEELKPQWREKINIDWDNLPILFLGYGKLGSFELGYNSDLDMVILYDDQHLEAASHFPFLLRLARKTIDVISLYTITGKCYEVDCRLRPDGDKGLLVTGISQYKKYLLSRAWTWEKQALIKARSIAGNRDLAHQFVHIRKEVLFIQEEDAQLQQKIIEMREKMRRSLDRSNEQNFHIKQGIGGMIDIEFLTQYWALRLIPEHANLLRSRSVSSLLKTLAEYQQCQLDTKGLVDIYLIYRALVHQRALDNENSVIDNELFKDKRQQVTHQWQQTFAKHLPN